MIGVIEIYFRGVFRVIYWLGFSCLRVWNKLLSVSYSMFRFCSWEGGGDGEYGEEWGFCGVSSEDFFDEVNMKLIRICFSRNWSWGGFVFWVLNSIVSVVVVVLFFIVSGIVFVIS